MVPNASRGVRELPPVPTPKTPVANQAYNQDLSALRELDPSITSIYARSKHVFASCDSNLNEKHCLEGRMLIYARQSYPEYGFCIMKDQDTIFHFQHLYPEDDISRRGNVLMIKYCPDFTRRSLSVAPSIHGISNLCSSNGDLKILEMLGVAEDMIGFMMCLYTKVNKCNPNRSTSAHYQHLTSSNHNAPSPLSTICSVPSSPFSPQAPVLDTPPTSAAPSRCSSAATFSVTPFRPVQSNAKSLPTISDHRPIPNTRLDTLTLNGRGAPPASWETIPERLLVGGSGAQVLNIRNLAASFRMRGNASRRVPSSGLIQVVSNLESRVFDEPLINRDDLPSCPELHGVVCTSQIYFAVGGFSDVYEGRMNHQGREIQVAVKILRPRSSDYGEPEAVEQLHRGLERETRLWNLLRHQNILPFIGVSHEFGSFPALISPYCPSRDVISYLRRHPDVNRWPIVAGFTEGLRYLHLQGVIHGDVKGSNVLIGPKGEALICDFGISKLIGCRGFTTGLFGTPPFMAPELFPDFNPLIDEDATNDNVPLFCPKLTTGTDVYAYGLCLLQIVTGRSPKRYYPSAPKAQLLPKRRYYGSVNDRIWTLVESCCRLEAKERPAMDEVIKQILSIVDSLTSSLSSTESGPSLS